MRLVVLLVLVTALAACGGSVGIGVGGSGVGIGAGADVNRTGDSDHQREVDEWYGARVERLKREDGWLSLVGLFPLAEGTHRFGSAADNDLVFPATAPAHAGTITVANGTARLVSEPGAGMMSNGTPVSEIEMATDRSGAPTEIRMGSYRFVVIDRPGSFYLRVKDTENPLITEFTGIERYPLDARWRVKATFEPYDPPRRLTIANVMGFDEQVDCPGALVFTFRGETYRLEPLSDDGEEMWIVFGDKTNGFDTYGGGRFLYCPSPDSTGTTYIDFNKSYNPPCVFTPYATCPLPHPENVMPIRVTAGEKVWGENH